MKKLEQMDIKVLSLMSQVYQNVFFFFLSTYILHFYSMLAHPEVFLCNNMRFCDLLGLVGQLMSLHLLHHVLGGAGEGGGQVLEELGDLLQIRGGVTFHQGHRLRACQTHTYKSTITAMGANRHIQKIYIF